MCLKGPAPTTGDTKPKALNPKPSANDRRHKTLNPKPYTLNTKP